MTISSTEKDMLIQFLTDDVQGFHGFRAFFHYMPIEPNCVNWLNLTALFLNHWIIQQLIVVGSSQHPQ